MRRFILLVLIASIYSVRSSVIGDSATTTGAATKTTKSSAEDRQYQLQMGGSSSSPNKSSLSRKRILSELRDIKNQLITLDVPFNSSSDEIGVRLSPMRTNLLEWHFSFTGIAGSPYSDGIYHGRIMLHPEYPRKAPSICMFTPTGRWEVGKDICLSATAHHQETWNPSWNLRTLVMALRGYMVCKPGEIGSISTTADRQRALASQSVHWRCPVCGVSHASLCASKVKETENGRQKDVNEIDSFQNKAMEKDTENSTEGLGQQGGNYEMEGQVEDETSRNAIIPPPNISKKLLKQQLKQQRKARKQIALYLDAIRRRKRRLALIRTFLLSFFAVFFLLN